MMFFNIKRAFVFVSLIVLAMLSLACRDQSASQYPMEIVPADPVSISYEVIGSKIKKMKISLHNSGHYASLSVYANSELLADNLNIGRHGLIDLNSLVKFNQLGKVNLTLKVRDAKITIKAISFEDISNFDLPMFNDISKSVGIDKVNSIKYGGPTIADIDNDGDYDFIVNNHNEEASKLYWNNGDGTVSKHDKNLSRWFMHDVHGTATGDYDNDGDLDLVVTMGGGNGKDPSKANFYENKNGKFVLTTGDVGIERGGRGRGAKFSDLDLDGDLDLILINEASLTHSKPQHYFYENINNGTFRLKTVADIEDIEPSRALISDINNDSIDDIIFYSPLSIWLGNGDFSFTNVSHQIPKAIRHYDDIMAITDFDFDNDGDFDLYLARGKEFGVGKLPSLDHDPITGELDIKPNGTKGIEGFTFKAAGDIKFYNYDFLAQGIYRDQDYPLFLGKNKDSVVLAKAEDFVIKAASAQGWPEDISRNGMYFGHLGNNKWKAALVRDGDVFWGFSFSLSGVSDVTPHFEVENRNVNDVLLRNDQGQFVDITAHANVPTGGNSLGVTTGDFNNDSHQDLLVYRWGYIGNRIADTMLLNTGKDSFERFTMHGANDIGGSGNGDMGQAFDFDLDGDLDILSGSEGGQWYMYSNQLTNKTLDQNYALVKVGYAPVSNIDAISAEVIVKTDKSTYRKRVGSRGAIFSQSLHNIIHFGLAEEQHINSIEVVWRNGESTSFKSKSANQLFDTDSVDANAIVVAEKDIDIRQGTTKAIEFNLNPINADIDTLEITSSNSSLISVNKQGLMTAHGIAGEHAKITISAGSVTETINVNIVPWVAYPASSLTLSSSHQSLIVGQSTTLAANILPKDSDGQQLIFRSSNDEVLSVSEKGEITALAAGEATITVSLSSIRDTLTFNVVAQQKPFIEIVNAEQLQQQKFYVGDSITLKAKFHAGSGEKVISSDEGGVRFWLRQFKYKWIPAKDTILIDETAIGKVSGESSKTFSLKGFVPSTQLPKGHFYYLSVSFANSDGSVLKDEIYPITLLSK